MKKIFIIAFVIAALPFIVAYAVLSVWLSGDEEHAEKGCKKTAALWWFF